MRQAPRKSVIARSELIPGQPRPKRSSIRRSTDRDLAVIRAWLEDEDARELPGNFLCNIEVIEECHREGELLVYCDGATGEAVAFQLGGLIRPGILAVRHEFRRKGIGRKLAERCIALARKRNQPLLYITCKPSSSVPFWNAMGFVMASTPGRSSDGAYRVLETELALPSVGRPAAVEVSFYPEAKKWHPDTPPYCTYRPLACQADDGVVHLERRLSFHNASVIECGDVVVEVVVDGERLHLDKAKYDESKNLGVVRCTNGYYIDQIKVAMSGVNA
ncbi:MAG TPA: GNAT family N-acetyltransferase [Arenimonas sp.]|uniref:GNAT family N-acetyltransferase n=1 Tax=Arenimonas sp. TaxID=1872635 RepID=UPI002D7F10A9|nr:GNAT family N-acetyltransferase [Arenimonas sp.]HEU0153173.1 GNAT family N-acetyltransferase [Arenimonas sp.]